MAVFLTGAARAAIYACMAEHPTWDYVSNCATSDMLDNSSVSKVSLFCIYKCEGVPCIGIWQEASTIRSNELIKLSQSLPEVIQAGLASSTTNKYALWWKNWVNWSSSKPEVETLPANPFFVALFLNHVLESNQTKGAITSSFYGIRWAHHIAGLDSPTDHPFTKLAFEGCLRLINNGHKQPKEPITPENLKFFLKTL